MEIVFLNVFVHTSQGGAGAERGGLILFHEVHSDVLFHLFW